MQKVVTPEAEQEVIRHLLVTTTQIIDRLALVLTSVTIEDLEAQVGSKPTAAH